MPYGSTGRLAAENASKLGHLDLVNSPWIKDLVSEFEHVSPPSNPEDGNRWTAVSSGAKTLQQVWAVDGSFATVSSTDKPPREVAFVKAALISLDGSKLAEIDAEQPHPLLLQDILRDSGVFLPSVFPLRNVRTTLGSNYDAVRHIVRETLQTQQMGAFHRTLEWLAFGEWRPTGPQASPAFECPHRSPDGIDAHMVPGLPANETEGDCPHCGGRVFLTDLIGLHLDMVEDGASERVVSGYMLVAEHLMLFTPIHLLWHHSDPSLVTRTLFLKDGPLSLRAQYSRLVPPTRAFLQHAKDAGRPVHVCGQEKTGVFADHFAVISGETPPSTSAEPSHFRVLSHAEVRGEVQRSTLNPSDYGFRVNWGEKVLLKVDPHTRLVLSIPTGDYIRDADFPSAVDIIGLDRILTTLPGLLSRRHESGLYPIELAHGIASLSSYPSAAILQRLVDAK